DHKDEDLEYNPEDINQIIFFKEIYNYLSQSGHFPIKIEERREVIQFIDREGKGVDLPGIDTKDLQTFKTSLIHAIREAIQLFTNRKDGTNLTAKNHFFLNEPQISDFDLLPFTKSVGGEAKFLEKDVLPVFIREIKSSLDYTHNIKPIIAEDILNANEVVTQGKLSRDKGHNQTFNFNNFSGTENTFFSIENNNGEIYMDFNAPDKPLSLDDKYNDLYTISKKGDASIEISLEPNGMGEIDIELVLDKGVINAQINASENIGKEFIEKNLDNIMRVLISEGLHIGSFSVSLQNKEGTSVYGNKKEDIQDIRLANVRNLSNAEHNEGLISIFV
ncbi:MAG: flagellar hook-length control protein FliK, partial [Nitrospirae bacterium]|nr:flagellar hook-length control protein FliK [Nitrospirota bacterium]